MRHFNWHSTEGQGRGAPILTQASLVATLLAYSGQPQPPIVSLIASTSVLGRIRRIADLETLMSMYPQATELQMASEHRKTYELPLAQTPPMLTKP